MNFIKKISLLWLIALLPITAYAATYMEGKDYTKLTTPVATKTGDKIEVLEFFWYGCPHCFSFEPTLKKWKASKPANVTFTRVPAPLNPRWMPQTKTFYALQVMGEGEKYHEAIFSAMHVQKMRINNKDSIASFLATKGVDKKTFLSTFDSFAVEMRARQAMKLGQDYKVNGVPLLVINGKYTVSGSQAGSYENLIKITNYLIKQETK